MPPAAAAAIASGIGLTAGTTAFAIASFAIEVALSFVVDAVIPGAFGEKKD